MQTTSVHNNQTLLALVISTAFRDCFSSTQLFTLRNSTRRQSLKIPQISHNQPLHLPCIITIWMAI